MSVPPVPDRLATALEGRYRLERVLGQGDMATVHLAEDLKHHRQVAIKVLRPELAAVLGADRFVQEIEISAASAARVVWLCAAGNLGAPMSSCVKSFFNIDLLS